MKHYLNVVLGLLSCVVSYGDSHKIDQFNQAIELYKQKQFDQAYQIFNAIEPKNAAIWYNLGNCAYKRQDYEHALACWRCAGALGGMQHYIDYNSAVIATKLGNDLPETSFKKVYAAYRAIPLITFQLFFLVFWFSLLFFIKNYKRGTKYRSLFFTLLVLMTTLTGIALGFKYHSIKQRRGIVMKHSVSLFAGPDEQYHVLGSLAGVTEVMVHEQRQAWCKVATPEVSGWVAQDSIVVI